MQIRSNIMSWKSHVINMKSVLNSNFQHQIRFRWEKVAFGIGIGSRFEMSRIPLAPCADVECIEWVDLSESGLEDLDPISMRNAINPCYSTVSRYREDLRSRRRWFFERREFEFQTQELRRFFFDENLTDVQSCLRNQWISKFAYLSIGWCHCLLRNPLCLILLLKHS